MLKPRGKAFAKGHKKLGGRGKGSPNKVGFAVKEFFKELVDDPSMQTWFRSTMKKRGNLPAFLAAVEHVVGKPTQRIETPDLKIPLIVFPPGTAIALTVKTPDAVPEVLLPLPAIVLAP